MNNQQLQQWCESAYGWSKKAVDDVSAVRKQTADVTKVVIKNAQDTAAILTEMQVQIDTAASVDTARLDAYIDRLQQQ